MYGWYGLQFQHSYINIIWRTTRRPMHSLFKATIRVKSDRVYALRKQYDAFLEEDKVRKERNEYILGKLDKMRSCNALVPLRNKDIFSPSILSNCDERYLKKPAIISREGLPTTPQSCDFSLSCVTSYIGEKILLQEMCKKYIIIPKTDHTTNDDPLKNIRTAENDTEKIMKMKDIDGSSTDWKKKYDILDKIKRDEVERDSHTTMKLKNEHEQIVHNIILNNILENQHTEVETDKNKCFEQKLPVRDNIEYTSITQIPDNIHISYKESRILPPTYNLDINAGDENINEGENKSNTFYIHRDDTHVNPGGHYTEQQQSDVTQYTSETVLDYDQTHSKEDKNMNEGEITNNTFNSYREETTKNPDGIYTEEKQSDEKPYFNETELGYDQTHSVILDYKYPETKEHDHTMLPDGMVILTTNDINEISDDKIIESNQVTQQYEYPSDPGQTQEFLPEEGDVLRDGVYINPIVYNTTQEFETGHDQSEFSTEYLHVPDSEQREHPVKNEVECAKSSENIALTDHIQQSDIKVGEVKGQNLNESEFEPLVENDDKVIPIPEDADFLVDSSQIEEFNAEQNNMFYSEQTENVQLDNQYTEHTQRPYVDDYTAAYYEGTQQPIDINEHEETNQYYDQSYQQQYYDQPNQDYNQLAHEQPKGFEYDQMPQTYEPGTYGQAQENYNQSQENYDQQQQNYERLHYDEKNYVNPKDIEEQLDLDENIVVQKPLIDDVNIQPSKVDKEPNINETPDIKKT